MRRRIRASSSGVELHAVAESYEEHDPFIAIPVLPDHEALDDLFELLDLPVDLRRADANAAGIEDRVRAAVDHQAIVAVSST